MAVSALIRHDIGYLSTLPLGSVIGWHRDLDPDRPAPLPPGWVEANGQVLDDPESPYHGHILPNLNGATLAGEGGLFLRGSTRSGTVQQDQLQSHTHEDAGHVHPRNTDEAAERVLLVPSVDRRDGHMPDNGDGNSTPVGKETGIGQARLEDPVASSAGEVRHGAETRPANMSVIWILKVKQVTAARAVPAVEAHAGAPLGAVYIGAEGRVGIGTATPQATLDVRGDLRLSSGATIREISTDSTFAGNRNDAVPTERAVREYIATQAGLGQRLLRGVRFDASDSDAAEREVDLPFRPSFLWVAGSVSSEVDINFSLGGPISGFAELQREMIQLATGPRVRMAFEGISNQIAHDSISASDAIAVAHLDLHFPNEERLATEGLRVEIVDVHDGGLLLRLQRTPEAEPLPNFNLQLALACFA